MSNGFTAQTKVMQGDVELQGVRKVTITIDADDPAGLVIANVELIAEVQVEAEVL